MLSRLNNYHKTEYPIETNLFTKGSLTQAIKTLYFEAADEKEIKVKH